MLINKQPTWKFGYCDCGSGLYPEWFEEKEYSSISHTPTGRVRNAVSCLYCPICDKRFCIDDTFDGAWYYKNQ